MTLAAGSKLGPYEILAPIGAGGMGEVYRAKDPRLGREVAIKVLPASFSADADRLRRFEQEARAAGVLNHPNITAVHDIGTHEGAPYVVQELLEGDTLRSVLSGGRLPQRKTIDYGLQIVHGLAAAHEKGIVHRDLKPENVFVTNDGRVKILDFGLAKLTHTEERGQATNLPTATAGTEPGVVMGTLGYMSPEQVRGKPADARSDIFSFGAILYEMLSGKRAFHGDSAADTMSAILKEDPPDLSITNQNIPPGLERIVRHCLEKSPEQRFHSAHDVAFDLEALSGLSTPRLEPSKARMPVRLPSRLVGAALLATLAIGLLAGRLIWRTGPEPPPIFHRLTFRRGPIQSARFAPDGNSIIYSASWDGAQKPDIFSTRVESPESLLLNLPDRVIDAISRTGEMLVLKQLHFSTGYAITGTLSQAPLSGSTSRELLEDVADAAWSPDGANMAVVRAPQWRYRLEFPAGKVLYETTGYVSDPRVSPKGDAIAFLDHPIFGDDRGSVAILDLAGKKTALSGGMGKRAGHGLVRHRQGALVHGDGGGQRPLSLRGHARGTPAAGAHDARRTGAPGHLPRRARPPDPGERSESGSSPCFPVRPESGTSRVSNGRTTPFCRMTRARSSSPSRARPAARGIPSTCESSTARRRCGWERESLRRSLLTGSGSWPPRSRRRPGRPCSCRQAPGNRRRSRRTRSTGLPRLSGRFFRTESASWSTPTRQESPRAPSSRISREEPRGPSPRRESPARRVSPDGKSLLTETAGQGFGIAPLEGGGPSVPIRGLEPNDKPLRWTADGRSLFVGSNRGHLPRASSAWTLRPAAGSSGRSSRRAMQRASTASAPLRSPSDGNTILFGYGQILSDLYVVEGLR